MALAALLISLAGLAVAGLSARYAYSQVKELRRQFNESGPVVDVSSSFAFPVGRGSWPMQVSVTVTNKGRIGTTIKNWGFVTLDDQGTDIGAIFGTMHTLDFPQESVPRPLAAHDSFTWYFNRNSLESAVRDQRGKLHPFADLGDGSRVLGDRIVFK
ncbi:MAG: hypothetical protein WCF24_12450 [Acidimicrobiales bacterium]